jgi:hypothetical protein
MTTTARTFPDNPLALGLDKSHDAAHANLRFDRWVAVLSTIFLLGLFLDGWAHNNIDDLIETFFTPYHGVLYGGLFLVAGFLSVNLVRNVAAGVALRKALPKGYILCPDRLCHLSPGWPL